MVDSPRSIIPLFTVTRGGTTVRWTSWPGAIRSEGKLYKPFRFMFVFDYPAESSTLKRVEIVLDHAVPFLTPFPSECPLTATLQIVTDRDHNRIIRRFVGALTFENDKIYFEPGRLVESA